MYAENSAGLSTVRRSNEKHGNKAGKSLPLRRTKASFVFITLLYLCILVFDKVSFTRQPILGDKAQRKKSLSFRVGIIEVCFSTMSGLNKMMIMLPLMFAARKLDSEDPQTVYWLRIAYGVMQTLCVLAVVYTYYQASLVTGIRNVVYVPPPPQVSDFVVFYRKTPTFCCFTNSL